MELAPEVSQLPVLDPWLSLTSLHIPAQSLQNQLAIDASLDANLHMEMLEMHITEACSAWMQTASKDISQLEVVKVTLQPKDGIMMLCKPRT